MVGGPTPTPIAIVGIGCRFARGIDSPASLWRALLDEVDVIGPAPDNRFPDTANVPDGGFLDDIELFDSGFFGISAVEADRLDPQHRLLLETGWAAIEDAGVRLDAVAGPGTGVFVGLWTSDYAARLSGNPATTDLHATTGTGRFSGAGRLSYFLDARGPSVSIDTASSSSLVAVHLATESLRSGETNVALAGGANAIVEPTVSIAFGAAGMLAADSRCKFGDQSADGYGRGEGSAIVVLKRLADAVEAGDRVYAVIASSVTMNEGRASGFLTRPAAAAQAEMLRRAYDRAGIDPTTVHYVEAHGTGTPAGDPVELGAIGNVLGRGRSPESALLVGSVKTNLGHTEAAAGIAGLVKAALAIDKGTIPASLHVGRRTDAVEWEELGLELVTAACPWPTRGVRRAGVSSFGLTGANAHVVLEGVPRDEEPVDLSPNDPLVLPLSARSEAALHDVAAAWADTVATMPMADACACAAMRRSLHEHRAAFVAADPDSLRAELLALAAGTPDPQTALGTVGRPTRTVFIFSGQGSQWVGMGRELAVRSEAFGAELERVDAAIYAVTGWSPIEKLHDANLEAALEHGDIVQPLLFAVKAALAAHWRSVGVTPDAVVGHSMGEVVAAYVAGALTLADAVQLILVRSSVTAAVRGGRMLLVGASAAEIDPMLADQPGLSIAVINSPDSTVVSGPESAIDALGAQLDGAGVFNRRVATDIASHSAHMDAALPNMRAGLALLEPRNGPATFYSTVEARPLDGISLDADYWARNLRETVRFGETVQTIAADAPSMFIEVSPHPMLLPSVMSALGAVHQEAAVVASLRRGEPELDELVRNLAAAHAVGAAVDWSMRYPFTRGGVELPTHPRSPQRHWIERGDVAPISSVIAAPGPDPLLVVEPDPVAIASFKERVGAVPDGPMRLVAIEDEIVRHLGAVLQRRPEQIDRQLTFESQGLESLMAVEFRTRLAAAIGVGLSPTMTYNYPTVRDLARDLRGRIDDETPDEHPTGLTGSGVGATSDIDAALAAELDAVDRLLEEGR